MVSGPPSRFLSISFSSLISRSNVHNPNSPQSVLSFSGAFGNAKNVDSDDDLFSLPHSHRRSGSSPNTGNERFAALAGLDLESGLEGDAEMDLALDWEYHPLGEGAPGDLWFEEDADADTVGGSQELLDDEGGLCFSDDDDSVSGNVRGPGLELDDSNHVGEDGMGEDDFDDLWASSQSTLDDVRAYVVFVRRCDPTAFHLQDGTLEWEDYSFGSSQSSNAECTVSTASWYSDMLVADEDEEDRLDVLAGANNQLEQGNDFYASVSRSGVPHLLLSSETLEPGHASQLVYSAGLEFSLDDADDLAIESAPNVNLPGSCAAVDALEGSLATSSYLPVPLSGDPACALDRSRSPPGPAAVPSSAPFTRSALHLPVLDLGGRPDGRERRSPDGEKLFLRF
ncbi:hypothetical protein PYCCODRAFT_1463457 [Trametes coccinea BRFM310]|uniref:Uncharacterized protein n=1 Tax=Trametes coccinea (strain BRFM310) TaxID=1353009 RepID=A0A1Y2J168_TRAC3|nr:hypothetical protein PYCCODRAFT_1463457 [Trametes coccinea BRFM310]